MTRSEELALAKELRSIALLVAANDPIREGVCVLCNSLPSRRKHRSWCPYLKSLRARAVIAAQDIENAREPHASLPTPAPECEWCGGPSNATDPSGNRSCDKCESASLIATSGAAVVL